MEVRTAPRWLKRFHRRVAHRSVGRNSSDLCTRRRVKLTLTQDVRFLGTLAQPLGYAARVNTARAFRSRWRQYRFWTGAAITGCDPIDPANIAQPDAAYRALHAGGRVHYNPKRGLWILSRLPDVRAAARAADTMSR